MNAARDVDVIDDLLPSDLKEKLFETISWVPVYFLNRGHRYKSHELDIHWYYPLISADDLYSDDVESTFRTFPDSLSPVIDAWDCVKTAIGGRIRLYECTISANTFGTEGFPHHDIEDRERRRNHVLVIIYCNPEWKTEWAGETVFFDDSGEIISAVMPKPGRVLVVRGDRLHVGRSVSRICPYDRRVLVFKMWLLENGE